MKTLLASLLSAILVIGCGGAQSSTASQSSASQSSTSQSSPSGQSEDPNACVAPGESPSAETCGFVANGCCYASAELACQAAGCSTDGCTVLESFPAQVRCP